MENEDYFVKIASPTGDIDKIQNLDELKDYILDFGISEMKISINEDRILLHPIYNENKVKEYYKPNNQ